MYWTYIIKSKTKGVFYIGSTNNLVKRLQEHNLGKSRATAPYRPWTFAYVEGYAFREDAIDRERKLKQFGRVYAQLKRRIKHSLSSA